MALIVPRTPHLWVPRPKHCSLLTHAVMGLGGGSIASVVFLCHFDGTDASTTFTDVKGHALTPVGNAQLDTAQLKFGTASGLFDGTGDYVTAADSADWHFGSGNFTVECFARFVSVVGPDLLAGQYGDGTNFSWLLYRQDGTVQFVASADGTTNTVSISGGALLVDTWYHIAAVRNGNRFDVYLDGTSVANVTTSFTLFNSSRTLEIGGNTATSLDLNGWIDEMRISKGIAQYTANFTPPTAPFPDS